MAEIFAGLASNADDAARRLHEACAALAGRYPGFRASGVYRSPDCTGTGAAYLNLVVAFESPASPRELRERFRRLEHAAGRRREGAGPVALDIDLLLHGDRVQNGPPRLPRPEILGAPHVLAPLAELAGERRHPVTGQRLAEAWQRLQGQREGPEALGPLAAVPAHEA